MTSEQALFLRDLLLHAIQEEFSTTKRVLAAVPDERSDYRPDPKYRTARELAWHIVDSEIQFFDGIARGSFGSEEAPNPTSKMAEMIAHYDAHFKAGVEKIREMSGEQLAATINFFGVAEFPAVIYLTWLSNHSIHHRGQLSAYLRPMGAKVPAIYGPSGDEMWQQSDAASV